MKLIFLSLISAFFEFMGLVLIFQFVLFISSPNSEYSQKILNIFSKQFSVTDFQQVALLLGILVASIYIFKNIFMLFFTKINNNILQDFTIKTTIRTLKNLLFQDYLTINSINKEEKLNIISKIELVAWEYCLRCINLIANSAIIIILLFYLFAKFTLPAIVALAFMGILSTFEYLYLKSRSNHQTKHFSNAFSSINSTILTIINSTKEIKLNNKEEYFLNKYQKNCEFYSNLIKDRNYNSIFHIYFTEISIMTTFIIILFALYFTSEFNNSYLISSLCTICMIVLRITPAINRAQSCLYGINSTKKLAIELIEFDNKFKELKETKKEDEKLPLNSTIEIKNIEFSYDNDKTGLKDINLTINKGDFIGIIGKSGEYKTTLSLIISGLIKAQKGEILIDNVPLSNFSKWRNNISHLTQDYNLITELLDEIPDNLITKLNLENKNINELSNGQKQRLALANILNQDKDVIILDEITSSQDVIIQEEINKILTSLKGQKTIISIAHRLQILKNCTKIIYMDKGQIIDFDTLENLTNKYEDFRKIVELSDFKIN